jgi:hypothetical protein
MPVSYQRDSSNANWRDDGFVRATALLHMADAYETHLNEVIETLRLGVRRQDATSGV